MRRRLVRACTFAAATGIGLAALGTAPAAAAVPSPTIVSMIASYGKARPTGVPVIVKAATNHARYCRLFYPAALGRPMARPADCSKNSFRRALRVPVNRSPYVRRYKVTLKATGRGGTTFRSLIVRQLPDQPSITAKTISPRRPDHYGGPVRLGAKLHSTVRCWLTATGGLKISSKPFRCSGTISRTVNLPANNTAYGRTFTVTLHARNPIAATSAGYRLFQPAGPPTFLSFGSKPDRIGAGGGKVTVSATFLRTQTCDFAAAFPNGGQESVGPCHGKYAQAFQIPANHSGKDHTYSFTLRLRGRGGKAEEEYTLIQPSG